MSKSRLPMIEGWMSIIGNLLLFGLKFWVGVVTGSVALTADAWHTLTDSASSAIVVFSAWFSTKPADEHHPFGHGRMDLVCSVIVGVLLLTIGVEFVGKGIEQLKGGKPVVFGVWAVSVTILSVIIKEAMAQFAFWASRKTGNPLLKADGWHHRTDSLSSVVVLAGILISRMYWWVDGALGILVALMILYASYQILRDSMTRLIGEPPDELLMHELAQLVDELQLEVVPHHFHLHRYGDHVELTFHLTMNPSLTLEQAHQQAHLIETALRDRCDIEATIHMEPGEARWQR